MHFLWETLLNNMHIGLGWCDLCCSSATTWATRLCGLLGEPAMPVWWGFHGAMWFLFQTRPLEVSFGLITHPWYWGFLWIVLIKQSPETGNTLPWCGCGLHERGEAKASWPIQFLIVRQSFFLTNHDLQKNLMRIRANGPNSLVHMKYLLSPHYVFNTWLAISHFTLMF